MFIDIAIVITLVIAVYVGYQRGVVQPLLAEIFFLAAILIIMRDRRAYTDAMQHYLHANAVFAVFLALVVAAVAGFIGAQVGGLIHRMPVVRGVDGFLGIFVHAAFVVVISYLLISALVTFDKAFSPTVNAATLTLKQVNSLATQLQANPITSSLVSPDDLAQLRKEAATPNGAHLDTVSNLSQLQNAYEQFLQPQLAGSRTAPVILAIGQRIPFIGHTGPKDLPGRSQPSPAASPSPAPKASPTK